MCSYCAHDIGYCLRNDCLDVLDAIVGSHQSGNCRIVCRLYIAAPVIWQADPFVLWIESRLFQYRLYGQPSENQKTGAQTA